MSLFTVLVPWNNNSLGHLQQLELEAEVLLCSSCYSLDASHFKCYQRWLLATVASVLPTLGVSCVVCSTQNRNYKEAKYNPPERSFIRTNATAKGAAVQGLLWKRVVRRPLIHSDHRLTVDLLFSHKDSKGSSWTRLRTTEGAAKGQSHLEST